MRALLRPFHPTTLGGGPAFLFVYMAGYVTAILQLFVLLTRRLPSPPWSNWRHVVLNYWLLGLLGLAYLVWRVARQRPRRARLRPLTGPGELAGRAPPPPSRPRLGLPRVIAGLVSDTSPAA